jgi:PAS domain S-box-containing protein
MNTNTLLARRLAAQVVIVGCLITLVVSYVQIRVGVAKDKDDILEDVDRVMLSGKGALEQNLWQMDVSSVRMALDGIGNMPGVHYVAVMIPDGSIIAVGETRKGETVSRSLNLTYNYRGEPRPLGVLTAEVDFEGVNAATGQKAAVILALSGLIVFGVAGFVLAVHFRMVGRHVQGLSRQLAGLGIDNLDAAIELDRKPGERPDELDHLAAAIRRMLADLSRSVRAERESAEQLEAEMGRRFDAECALGESERRYQTLFEHAADSILILDLKGRILEVNLAACQALGYSRQELLSMTLAGIDTPESLALAPERLEVLRREGRNVFESEHRCKDGRIMPVEVNVRTFEYEGFPAILSSCRDITQRREAQMRQQVQTRYLTCHLRVSELALVTAGTEELCRMICDEIAATLDYPVVAVEFYDPGRQVMVFKGVSAASGMALPFETDAARSVSGTVVRTGLSVAETDVSWRPDYADATLLALGVKTFLCFPLRCKEQIIGALSMASPLVKEIDDELVTWGGSMANYVASLIEHKRAEFRIASSLKEKDILLREIHHRVKNNLQIVSSLLRLQAHHIADPVVLGYFEESQSRMMAMALVHEELYKTSDLSLIGIPEFLNRLVQRVVSAFGRGRGIETDIESEDIQVCIDVVIPLGLIVNELTVNALKHAFNGVERGRLTVRFIRQDDDFVLRVADNGRGLPPWFVIDQSQTLGMQLVASLAEQLRGQVTAASDNGAVFVVRFPARTLAKAIF